MFYEILGKQRNTILPLLSGLKNRFYLAGGTALALQVGHRDSIDFDFFTESDFNTSALYEELKQIFSGHTLLKTQEEKNTLSIVVDGAIRVSFFSYAYPLIMPKVQEEYLTLASLQDIACMKLSAITGRATMKDYVDIFFLLKQFDLKTLLGYSKQKHPSLDVNLILKSLVYFDDVPNEPITFTKGNEVSFEAVKKSLKEAATAI